MHIKKTIRDLITASAERARASGALAFETMPAFEVEATKHAEHGDLATNLALILAKQAKHAAPPGGPGHHRPPRGPGGHAPENGDRRARVHQLFHCRRLLVPGDRRNSPDWDRLTATATWAPGQKVQVEFVSANPTGPLHIGHGRGAALGDALANLLAATGHTVEREYYINDVGNRDPHPGQIPLFPPAGAGRGGGEFPADGYQGDYMKDLARDYLAAGHAAPGRTP